MDRARARADRTAIDRGLAPTILCDTSVVSSSLRDDERIARMRQRLGTAGLAVSVVTVAEIKRGALAARWDERRTVELDDHLRGYVVLTVDAEIAKEWARVQVRCAELGRQKGDNDLWVAATAKRYSLPLATLDRDHYDIPGLTVIREDGSEVTVPE